MLAGGEHPAPSGSASAWVPAHGNRASEIVAQIRAAFFRGMRPGDWLGTESELAERFGVSRLTVRDAVRTLEAQGIVEVKVGAGGGLRIADSDPDHFGEALAVQVHLLDVSWEEIAEAMRAVEPHAAQLAAQRRTDDHLTLLRKLLDEQLACIGDAHRFNTAASDFHIAIAEASGNRALYVAARALRRTHDRLLEPVATPDIARHVAARHRELCNAVAAGDGDWAHRLMQDHLDKIAQRRLH